MQNIYQIHKRIYILLVLIILMFSILLFRLTYIQVFNNEYITKRALELWSRNIPIEGKRGNIYDRNGVLLVTNELAPSIAIIPKQIEDKEAVASFLSEVLEVDKSVIMTHLNKNVNVELIKPSGRKIDVDKAYKVIEKNFKGVYVVGDTIRNYVYGDAMAQVLGFTGIDNQGIAGLEYVYDEYLKGDSGALKIYTDAKGGLMDGLFGYYESSVSGMDIYLTIDIEVQLQLEKAIDDAVARYNPDEMLLLSTDPATGEILGMAQYPSYDPANYQDYDQETYNRNLPIWKSYEPGSVFKIVTYAAGLEEGIFKFDDRFYDPGYAIVDGTRIKDWKPGGHGEESMLEVIMNSCNPGFIQIGLELGKEKLFDYIEKFGFGKKTGVDLLGESTGIVFDLDDVGPVELATSSFGQGNSTTPIQLVQAASAAVNGGNLMRPFIVKSIGLNSINEVTTFEPSVVRRVISQETSSKMRYALEMVSAKGTGRGAYIDGYRVGGKTGTAQKVGTNGQYMDNNYILSFLGMAPMNNPEVAVYAAIDNPKNTIQFGGVVAAPIVKGVLENILPILGVEKQTDEQIDLDYRWYIDTRYVAVDSFVGKEVKSIKGYNYPSYMFKIIGDGSTVRTQIPASGERIPEGSTVILYT